MLAASALWFPHIISPSRSSYPTPCPAGICGTWARYGWKNVNLKADFVNLFILYAQSQWTKALPVICGGNSVDCTAMQVKYSQWGRKGFSKGLLPANSLFFHSRVWHVLLVKISAFFLIWQEKQHPRGTVRKSSWKNWWGVGDGVNSKGKWLHFPKAPSTTGVSNKGVELLDRSRQNSPLDSEI